MRSEARHLHGLSWLFITARSAKSLIVPTIFVLFASASNPWMRFELLGFVFLIPTLILAVVRQRIYNYRFAEDELIVRDGILTKKERHIPFDRIHNIAVVRNPFHRIWDVASARIETASGGKPEAVLRVLSLDAVHELREMALASPSGSEPRSPESESSAAILLSLPGGELVRKGLISGGGAIVFAAAAGILWQVQWWELDWFESSRILDGETPGWLQWLLERGSLEARILLALVGVAFLVIALRLFSVVWNWVKYHHFLLQRSSSGLHLEYGLLTKVSSVIPIHRIQLITAHSTLLHRCFARTSIDLESAGSSEEGSDLQEDLAQSGLKTRQFLAPLLPAHRTSNFLREVLPIVELDAVDWQPLSSQALHRLMKRRIILIGLITVLLALLLGISPIDLNPLYTLWLPAIVLPYSFVRITGWLRYTAWGMTQHAVYYRSGWLDRELSVLPFDKVQTIALRASPFDRRRGMARISVDTAGASSLGHRIHIPLLDREVANEVLDRLSREAGSTEFDW